MDTPLILHTHNFSYCICCPDCNIAAYI
ncbi:TRASH domain-containing protein [Blautia producta]